ncbi:hypothetical protein WDU94_012330 [Cyamophila willieti]
MNNYNSPSRPRVLRGSPPLLQGSGVRSKRARGANNLAVRPRLPSGNQNLELSNWTLSLNIGTFNTRTLSKDCKIDYLIQELDKINLDILVVEETRRKEEIIAKWKDGSQVFISAATNNAKRGGIGFIIRPKLTDMIESCNIINERIAVLVLKIDKHRSLKIIGCYAPTSLASDEDMENFYNDLECTLRIKTTYTIVCGDLNAKIGVGQSNEKFIGPNGLGTRNERGDRLAEFIQAEELYLMNSFFKKRTGKRWTWESPDGSRNEIDFFMTDCKRLIEDVETIGTTYFNVFSDHRLVRARIKINLKKENKIRAKSNHLTKNIQLNKTTFLNYIEQSDWSIKDDINEDYENFVNTLNDCKRRSTETIPKPSRNRLSALTLDMLEKRRKLKATNNIAEYKQISKELRTRISKDYEEYRQTKLKETVYAKMSIKKAEKELSLKQPIPNAMQNGDGEIKTKREEIEEIVSTFYNTLYSSQQEVIEPNVQVEKEIPNILRDEVEHAIKQMKKGRSAGMDRIHLEELSDGGPILHQAIAARLNIYINSGKIPKSWKTSKTVLLFKKGNREDIQNYRPICLLSHLYKLSSRIVLNRIHNQLDENSSRDQAGFKRSYSTMDHIHTLTQLLEKGKEYQMPICLLFIDFKKAFDTVEHNAVLHALIKQGVDHTYIKYIKECNENTTTQITLFKEPIIINIKRGVRQGDVISPNLFTSVLEVMLNNIRLSGGININGEKLQILLFADDIVLISHNPKTLEEMLSSIHEEAQKIGLSIHPGKTEWMRNKYCRRQNIQLNNTPIREVSQYKYLGQILTMDNDITEELKNRKKCAWMGYNKIKDILKNESIDMHLKSDLFNSHILPAITYGSETWNTTKKEEEGLSVTQRAIERRMCNISLRDHIRNTEIRKKTKVKDVVETVYTSKRKWAGHVARVKDNRWTKLVTEWYPRERKRRQGHPPTRWADPLYKTVGKNWMRAAEDRERWRFCDLQHWRDTSVDTTDPSSVCIPSMNESILTSGYKTLAIRRPCNTQDPVFMT